MYITYQMTYCTLYILMNFYIFYNDCDIFFVINCCCISSNTYHFCHHFLLPFLHHICYQQPIMIYMKMWNRQVIIYKEIHINVSYMMTKTFTYINFYRVNMNYLWNDIYTYSVEWYILTMLSSSKQTVSGHFCVCSSTCTYKYTNYCNSNQNSICSSQNDRYQRIEIWVATSFMSWWNISMSSSYDD